jgi:methylenetetrahydrofolate reductase (NADPH)
MCRDRGVTIPIIPGLKIVTRAEQLRLIPKFFGATVPERLVDEVMASPPDRAVDVGIAWALEQTRGLLDRGVPSVHFYVMQNTGPLVSLMELLQKES